MHARTLASLDPLPHGQATLRRPIETPTRRGTLQRNFGSPYDWGHAIGRLRPLPILPFDRYDSHCRHSAWRPSWISQGVVSGSCDRGGDQLPCSYERGPLIPRWQHAARCRGLCWRGDRKERRRQGWKPANVESRARRLMPEKGIARFMLVSSKTRDEVSFAMRTLGSRRSVLVTGAPNCGTPVLSV